MPACSACCRLRIGQLLGCRAAVEGADSRILADLEAWDSSPAFGAAERAALDYAEQFMLSAKDVSPEQRSALAHALGVSEPSTFVYGLYITEAFLRVLAFLDVDPTPDGMDWIGQTELTSDAKRDRDHIEWVEDEGTDTDARLMAAYYAFNRATCRAHGVDELTDEIVRLRSAAYHHCQFCQSVRREVEWPEDVADLMDEAVNYQTSSKVSPAHRAALELLDALVMAPVAADAGLRTRLLEQFTAKQIMELLMKEAFWMSNKPMISLGTDPGAVASDALTPFEYDDDGNFVLMAAPT